MRRVIWCRRTGLDAPTPAAADALSRAHQLSIARTACSESAESVGMSSMPAHRHASICASMSVDIRLAIQTRSCGLPNEDLDLRSPSSTEIAATRPECGALTVATIVSSLSTSAQVAQL